VVIPARHLGVFPSLPERAAAGETAVPAVWMVPGFMCMPRYWFPQDRGGLLTAAQIALR